MINKISIENTLTGFKDALLSSESLHGLIKIFGNLILAAFLTRTSLNFFQHGDTYLAILIGITAFAVFVFAIGYLLISIAGMLADYTESDHSTEDEKNTGRLTSAREMTIHHHHS